MHADTALPANLLVGGSILNFSMRKMKTVPVLVEVILLNLLVVLDRHCAGVSVMESGLLGEIDYWAVMDVPLGWLTWRLVSLAGG